MKKNLSLLIILTLLISCSQNAIEPQKAIQFSGLNNRMSKAANDNNANYKIYATTSLNTNQWYIDDTVIGNGNAENSPTKGPYYWPQNGTINFYAYAPANSNSIKVDGSCPTITLTYTVPPKADEDFTIATPIKGVNYNNENNTTVALQFQHMLSKVTTEVELSPELIAAGYNISNRGTTNLTVALTSYKVTITKDVVEWDKGYQAGKTTTYSELNTYYILPQVGYGIKIQLKGIEIKDKDGATVFTGDLTPYVLSDAETNGTSLYYLDPGESHILKFTINDMATTNDGTDYIIDQDIQFSAAIDEGWKGDDYINLEQIN